MPTTLTLSPADLRDEPTRRVLDALASDSDEPVVISTGHIRTILRELTQKLRVGSSVAILDLEATYSPAQAAELLGVSRSYVSRMIRDGRLPATKVGTHHRVAGADVARVLRQRQALDEILDTGAELEDYFN